MVEGMLDQWYGGDVFFKVRTDDGIVYRREICAFDGSAIKQTVFSTVAQKDRFGQRGPLPNIYLGVSAGRCRVHCGDNKLNMRFQFRPLLFT